MMQDDSPSPENKSASEETPKDLKKEAVDPKAVKKGYNEENPTQKHGAFPPDALADDTEIPSDTEADTKQKEQ